MFHNSSLPNIPVHCSHFDVQCSLCNSLPAISPSFTGVLNFNFTFSTRRVPWSVGTGNDGSGRIVRQLEDCSSCCVWERERERAVAGPTLWGASLCPRPADFTASPSHPLFLNTHTYTYTYSIPVHALHASTQQSPTKETRWPTYPKYLLIGILNFWRVDSLLWENSCWKYILGGVPLFTWGNYSTVGKYLQL